MLVLTVVSLLVLAFGQLAALVSIMLRYAFPNAPVVFRVLVSIPLSVSTAIAFALSWMALTGVDVILKVDALGFLLIFFMAKAFVWWLFVAYAVYCRVRNRPCGM